MRPVQKWHSDDHVEPTIQPTYNPYSTAKSDLERNLGGYCSYCERPATDEAAAVEHVQPKSLPQFAHLRFSWDNFLLACARCNGSDNKSNKDVIFENIHLPHRDNTVLSIVYGEGGFVKANPNLPDHELPKAQQLIDLVGLDKHPSHPGHRPNDKRWLRRQTVWEIAQRYLAHFQNNKTDLDHILELALSRGFWSVWYTVFEQYPEVRLALIQRFAGTAADCFNHQGSPIERP